MHGDLPDTKGTSAESAMQHYSKRQTEEAVLQGESQDTNT